MKTTNRTKADGAKTRARKHPRDPWIGLIYLDIFRAIVPVFLSQEDHIAAARAKGLKTAEAVGGYDAMACRDVDQDGNEHYALIIPTDVDYSTWAHECVHIADFVMNNRGIPCDAENTEIRAYLVGYMFERLEEIFEAFYLSNPELDPVRKCA